MRSTKPSADPAEINETQPLLAPLSDPGAQEAQLAVTPKVSDDEDDTPLPKAQILYLCYIRLVEPICCFSVFAFISQMIWEIGDISKGEVGFYAGAIESLFSITEMMLMVFWGKASDRFGRKPVLVTSLIGAGLATGAFGFGRSIWQLVFLRCVAGIFAGTVVTLRAMVSENSTAKTQSKAFSYFSVAGNIGIGLGPLIGGALAEPAKQYPSIFGGIRFFEAFPFALPTIGTGSFAISAALVGIFFVNETLGQRSYQKAGAHDGMTIRELLKYPGVVRCVWIYWYLSLMSTVYTSVLPVFWFTPVPLGGLGFSPLQISIFMALAGGSQSFWMIVVFSPLHKRIGTVGVLRICAYCWPFLFAFCPFANFLLRQGYETAFWCIYPPSMCIGVGVSMAFTCGQLALNDISPSSRTLGTLNSIALAAGSGLSAVVPALFTTIFAFGVTHQILSGYFIWVFEILVALGLILSVRLLPKEAYGIIKNSE